MSSEKKAICITCKGKLSYNELNDNIYAGLTESEYVCYNCQSEDVISEDDTELWESDSNDDF